MLQKHSDKVTVKLNSSALNNALSNLTARFNLEGELTLENSRGELIDLADSLQLLKEQGLLNKVITTVWVPSQLVLITQVFVPGSRKSDWMAALPYSLEESLSESVDNFHFVAFNRDSQGIVSVAMVENRWMKAWLQLLELHDLSHALLIPECFRVPLQEGTVADNTNQPNSAIYQADDMSLVRMDSYSGFAANADWLQQIQASQDADHVLTEMTKVAHHQLFTSQQSVENLSRYNLRTGSYRRQSKGLYFWHQWRWPVTLLVLALVVVLTSTWLESQKLAEQATYTKAQTQKLFKQMFPDVKRIIDIRTQTMNRLNQQSEAQQTGLSAMQMLGSIEPLLQKIPEVKINRITWRTTSQGAALVLSVESQKTDQLQKVISLSQNTSQPIKMTLQLKNVTPELAEGVFNVTAK